MTFYSAEIRDRVSMRDVLDSYGFDTTRRGRIPCPIHHGNGQNMAVSNKRFQCFVCGASGTVLDFVMQYQGVSLADAERILNDRFNLGLPLDGAASESERTKLDAERFKRELKKKRIEAERNRLESDYDKALSEWVRLDRIIAEKAPEGVLDEMDPEWVDALKRISKAAYELGESEEALHEFEGRSKGI